jgi:hypothetical protein
MTTAVAATPAERKRLTPESFAAMTAVLLVERRKPGFTKQIAASEIVAASDDVDRALVGVTKHLLDKKILKEINREDNAFTAYLESRAAFCSMLAKGMWAIPLGVVEEVDEEADGYKARRAALVRILAREKYAAAREDARTRLGKHYRESDYLTEPELALQFGLRTRWLSFNVASALEQVNAEIYQRETARLGVELDQAAEEIQSAYREAFAGLIETAADRLGSDPATGKPNRFQDSTIEKLKDFVATFAKRDITGDTELGTLAAKALDVLSGVPAERVRSNGETRTRVLAAVTEIKGTLRTMKVVPAKARKLRDESEV